MANPKNLVESAEQRHAAWTKERLDAQDGLGAEQAKLQGAQAALAAAQETFVKEEGKAATTRALLAAITTKADGVPLLQDLEKGILAQRAASAAMVKAEADVALAKFALGLWQSRLREIDARLQGAKAKWDMAKTVQARRLAAKDALQKEPLGELSARSTDLLAGETHAGAKLRVETDFPKILRDRALERAALLRARLSRNRRLANDLEGLLGAHQAAVGAPAARLADLEHAVSGAEAALLDWVSRAQERCDHAENSLRRIGDKKNTGLTKEQKKRVGDASLKSDRDDAAKKESERDQAQGKKESKQVVYKVEEIRVLGESGAEGLTKELAEPASAVAKARKEMEDADNELQAKENAYSDGMRNVMSAWEAAVPDSAWRDLFEFDEAKVSLKELQAGPVALVTALDTAESVLLAATIAADREEDSLRAYRLEIQRPSAQEDWERSAAARLIFGAMRGDG